MSDPLVLAIAVVGLACAIAYAVTGGADFGGGVWDLAARGPRRTAQREAIAHALTPVWEANHVWLIFLVVVLFAGFPAAYAEIGRGLFLPLHLALVGITLRGAAFVFRAYAPGTPRWGPIFGASSVITPFILGAGMGALSEPGLDWHGAVPVTMGALSLALCSYLAAVYLANETDGDLREDFRRRALAAGTATVALSLLLLGLVATSRSHLAHGLLSARAAPILAAGCACALASGFSLLTRRWRLARASAIAQIAFLIAGWGLAQYPYLVYPTVTFAEAGARAATLRFLLWTLLPGGAAIAAALFWLFRVFKAKRSNV
jgi:cytochrome bd ubiquinol oxidase subunit II